MSENNSGANIQQSEPRGGDQNKDKRQRFDSSNKDNRKYNNRNNNRRRRNNGQRQGGYDNAAKKADNAEISQDNKNRGRQGGRDQNREQNNKFKREQGEKRGQQFSGERKPKNKRPREIDPEVAKTVKKVETIDDIRSDNARITKEIYLEIASLKNINLN